MPGIFYCFVLLLFFFWKRGEFATVAIFFLLKPNRRRRGGMTNTLLFAEPDSEGVLWCHKVSGGGVFAEVYTVPHLVYFGVGDDAP